MFSLATYMFDTYIFLISLNIFWFYVCLPDTSVKLQGGNGPQGRQGREGAAVST